MVLVLVLVLGVVVVDFILKLGGGGRVLKALVFCLGVGDTGGGGGSRVGIIILATGVVVLVVAAVEVVEGLLV